MKLIDNWKQELDRLWSIRVAIVMASLSIADQLLPTLSGYIPPVVYAGLSIAVIVARLLAQPEPTTK